ncbi:asparagine synthase (glutamine-hydrolyzing) [Asinibacterium sp. OR53]|uniref:asparagine synthase (glutamine-hydrolyzing) n=1 Tax=Asinibacterium sp. OR53 TaxID=925409 RepID=UPI00047C6744|nr:asparagine synthase (glutamine-hydrolyzing) [Asinibacterium sp. OR53]
MCGIIGIASEKRIENKDWLAIGCDTLAHRGPDGKGIWWSPEENIGLGHRRLAIIDLSSDGNQPMRNIANDLCIVFNGEIYNYLDLKNELKAKGVTFNSQSDTEVILAAYKEWGTGCLSHLNGIFSFAIYDMRSRLIFLARDRAGEKPLFYTIQDKQLKFASELKALMADPLFEKEIDQEALDCYLAEGYVPGERCILKGTKKLPAAHAMTFNMNSGTARVWRYWQIPAFNEDNGKAVPDEQTLLEELEFLLSDAVRRQLIADVPVGVLLSGGVDSSLVTALAARSNSNLKTFTIRFPGHAKFDETAHARLIAHHFGTTHMELEAEPGTIDLLPVLARQFDEPIIDSSMIPTYLVSQMIRKHCTVALGGDGGDELFGGYSHYNRLLSLQAKAKNISLWLRRAIAGYAENLLPIGYKGRNWLQAIGWDFKNGLPLIASYYDLPSRSKLLNSQTALSTAERSWKERISPGEDLLQRATRTDFENYLPEDILVKVDRASMLNSLEVRAPMLDYRVIEFAYGKVPSSLKTLPEERKILLKRLAEKILPPEFDYQRKQGFSIPLSSWLSSETWAGYFREILLDRNQKIFNHQYIQRLFEGQAKGRNNGERLFGLVMFELWRKEYNIKN